MLEKKRKTVMLKVLHLPTALLRNIDDKILVENKDRNLTFISCIICIMQGIRYFPKSVLLHPSEVQKFLPNKKKYSLVRDERHQIVNAAWKMARKCDTCLVNCPGVVALILSRIWERKNIGLELKRRNLEKETGERSERERAWRNDKIEMTDKRGIQDRKTGAIC